MLNKTDRIIRKIIDQRGLTKEEILNKNRQLTKSLRYNEGVFDEDDSTIPQLLAQELNVDLGDPVDYLYVELVNDKWPICVRIIPFVTIDKEKIKQTLFRLGFELEEKFKRGAESPIGKQKYKVIQKCKPIGKIFMYLDGAMSSTFVREGILIHFELYLELDEDEIVDNSFDETILDLVDEAELFRTFSDYSIIRTADPDKVYIPYSIVDKVFFHPPKWVDFLDDNRDMWLKFPHITLESLKITPDIEFFYLYKTYTSEIIGVEALQYCTNLKEIAIDTELETLEFPPTLTLPNLELLVIQETEGNNNLDLSFLRNCPKLKEIRIDSTFFKKISFPLLENRHILRIEISSNSFLQSIVFPSPWYCPNLKEIELRSNDLETIDLSFLQDCHSLKELHLESNRLTALDLSPLRSCQQLKTLGLYNNRIRELDFSPLKDHPALEKVNLSRNKFEEIDLTPLHTCPKIQEVNLENTPVFSREIKKFQ